MHDKKRFFQTITLLLVMAMSLISVTGVLADCKNDVCGANQPEWKSTEVNPGGQPGGTLPSTGAEPEPETQEELLTQSQLDSEATPEPEPETEPEAEYLPLDTSIVVFKDILEESITYTEGTNHPYSSVVVNSHSLNPIQNDTGVYRNRDKWVERMYRRFLREQIYVLME